MNGTAAERRLPSCTTRLYVPGPIGWRGSGHCGAEPIPVQVTSVVTCSPGLNFLTSDLVGRRAVEVGPQPLVVQRIHVGGEHGGADVALAGHQADVGHHHRELRLVTDDVLRLAGDALDRQRGIRAVVAFLEHRRRHDSRGRRSGLGRAAGGGGVDGRSSPPGSRRVAVSAAAAGVFAGLAAFLLPVPALPVSTSDDDGDDDADHERPRRPTRAAASPVNLRRQRAMRFKIQHNVTVSPGHAESSDVARRVAGSAIRRCRPDDSRSTTRPSARW